MLRLFFIGLFILPFQIVYGQIDTVEKVKYTAGFVLKDGIYLTVNEFKNNRPSITRFDVIKRNQFSNPNNIFLEYHCKDSATVGKKCEVNECWGYCKNNTVYISHGYYGFFFKIMVIGSLSHFVALSGFDKPFGYGEPMSSINSTNDLIQYFLDTNTGDVWPFTYKNFSEFLKKNDVELYHNLSSEKQKRKLTFFYLLKYNERYPLSFPEEK